MSKKTKAAKTRAARAARVARAAAAEADDIQSKAFDLAKRARKLLRFVTSDYQRRYVELNVAEALESVAVACDVLIDEMNQS